MLSKQESVFMQGSHRHFSKNEKSIRLHIAPSFCYACPVCTCHLDCMLSENDDSMFLYEHMQALLCNPRTVVSVFNIARFSHFGN